MKLILAIQNPSKALQIQAFANDSITIQTLGEMGVKGGAIEDGTDIEENATKKALYAWNATNRTDWVMADDTGLFIHALDDAPGKDAACWPGEGKETTTEFCLEKMKGVTDRSATFKTVVILLSPSGEKHVFEGEVDGTLLEEPRGTPQPKMPYSSLFVPNGQQKCWTEMETEEENAISHRGKAVGKMITFLEENVI